MGSHNTQYIYNIDDPLYRILFSGLVEYEALRQLHIKDYHILEITRKDAFEAMNQHQDDEKIIKLLSEIKNNLIKNNEYID